jgi:hypothetical protein
MSLKNPVTPPGIDPGTVRLVAQRLNHYATPDSSMMLLSFIFLQFLLVKFHVRTFSSAFFVKILSFVLVEAQVKV